MPPVSFGSHPAPVLVPALAHLTQTLQVYLPVLARCLPSGVVGIVEAAAGKVVVEVVAEAGIEAVEAVEAGLPKLLLLRGSVG